MIRISSRTRWFIAAACFIVCVGPTFISYQPYTFRWDDSGYLRQSIEVSRVLWGKDTHGIDRLREIRSIVVGIRPPAMTLLGLPWGPLDSWDAGKCFVTLGAWTALIAAACLCLLARIGVKPLFLILAGLCVGAALGPWPPPALQHSDATALMADSLFAWGCLAALLLIPYEARTDKLSLRHAALRGALWGLILSQGAMTKINFLYFLGLILPILLVIRYRHDGLRSCWAALIGFAVTSAPAAAYLLRYGRRSLENGGASSFGALAKLYSTPLAQTLEETLRGTPGLFFYIAALLAALAYLAVKRRSQMRWPDLAALLMALGFGAIVFASPNLQFRYAFPLIVAFPFLLAVMLTGTGVPVPRRSVALSAALVSIILIAAAFPMQFRAQRRDSLGRADAVVAQALRCRNGAILLATDSATLNDSLLSVAVDLTGEATPLDVRALGPRAMYDLPISGDFQMLAQADAVVFQDDVIFPKFSNTRVKDYKRYIDQQKEYAPTQVWSDVTVYTRHCSR